MNIFKINTAKHYVELKEKKDAAFHELKLLVEKELKRISLIVKSTGISITLGNVLSSPLIEIEINGDIYYYKEGKKELLYDGELKCNDRRFLIAATPTILTLDVSYHNKLMGMLNDTTGAITKLKEKE